jgi:hypothetical protein
MPQLQEQIDFAESHIKAPDGSAFSLKGRQWVIDQIWRPLNGWKLWPVDTDKLCKDCAAKAGKIVDSYHDATANHGDCAGLVSEPILYVAVEVKRQQGKTFNAATWALSDLVLEECESIALLAGSEDQVGRIFEKNYRKTIKQSEELTEALTVRGTRIVCEDTGSDIEILPTALSSVSDTRTVVILDECRMVPPAIAAAVIPTTFSRGGWQCSVSNLHYRTHKGVASEHKKTCGVCGSKTEPWYARVLMTSSVGVVTDSDKDWFMEFVEHHKENPHPNVHVFASTETLNPKTSEKNINASMEVFGQIESMRVHMNVEAGGKKQRKGEDVVTQADVKLVSHKTLHNEGSSRSRAVAFLDSSNTVEKTSFVILAEDQEQSQSPWEHVYLSHLKFWWPGKSMKARVIDPAEVQSHLESVLPMYPNLEVLEIDPKLGARRAKDPKTAWPVTMMRNIRAGGSEKWRQKLKVWRPDSVQDDVGWDELERRILNQTLALQWVKEIFDEFKGITRKNMRVVDRNRDRMHADIIKAIACALFRIRLMQLRKGGPSMADLQAKVKKSHGRKPLTFGRRMTENDF